MPYARKKNSYYGPHISELPVRKSYEEKQEEIRQKIEPFLKPTTGRWPIYYGPNDVIKADCKVATVASWGSRYRWRSYKQCMHLGVISKDDILYCKIHDPDKPWPKRLPSVYRQRMEILKVEIPEKLIPKKERNKIEYRKSSNDLGFFRKLITRLS